ncbi:winged helix-turn-helix domain-containing protein [Halorussus sp. MSC15.2]|uniref:winged helix-turn-helix domain-containing protein n=1 Tax=Halorussus sp. MSC15.2 TaxID=2283638 RepID=UPI0013D7F73E|nr:winged helix-turn-helix domain-containing protein [Halorussus sp. MSC15.2]NEU59150.1 helix-turn-helix transcriptional regulator [Halorussus sp. MSC15.2]
MSADQPLNEGVELLSHEVRAEILLALAKRMREQPRNETLQFAELRDQVGHNDPGNFNYHLKRLLGTLVEKTDEGYRLSDVGHHFVAVLRSGRFDAGRRREFPEIETSCPVCGAPSTVTYEDGLLRTACGNDHTWMLNVGPELLDSHSVIDALNVATRRTLWEAKSTMDGVCPYCEGQTSETETRFPGDPVSVLYEWICKKCGVFLQNIAGGCVIFHPAVVGFCYQHGVDVFQHTWEILVENVGTATVCSEDPLRVQVGVSLEGERLELTLDDSAAVVNIANDGT